MNYFRVLVPLGSPSALVHHCSSTCRKFMVPILDVDGSNGFPAKIKKPPFSGGFHSVSNSHEI